jgi:hypothetical protein
MGLNDSASGVRQELLLPHGRNLRRALLCLQESHAAQRKEIRGFYRAAWPLLMPHNSAFDSKQWGV